MTSKTLTRFEVNTIDEAAEDLSHEGTESVTLANSESDSTPEPGNIDVVQLPSSPRLPVIEPHHRHVGAAVEAQRCGHEEAEQNVQVQQAHVAAQGVPEQAHRTLYLLLGIYIGFTIPIMAFMAWALAFA